jgi:hypothetical protein
MEFSMWQTLERWWSGGTQVDLVVVSSPEQEVLYFELIFFGNIISGTDKVDASITKQPEGSGRFRNYGGSDIIQEVEVINSTLQEIITTFL